MQANDLRTLVASRALIAALAGAIVVGGAASAARGDSELAKLLAWGAAPDDWFGRSVSISGDTVVIGAYGDDDAGTMSGSAYIFQRDQSGADNWGQVAKLTASDAAGGDQFGFSVSISGDTVVIGAYGDDDAGDSSGSAYVFQRDQGGADNWGQVAKVTASDAAGGDQFGFSVSISGDIVVVGAKEDDDAGSSSGSAYVFERHLGGLNSWGQRTKLTASDAAGGDRFGTSVSIDGDTVVIGAYYDDDAGSNSGSAYIFQRDQGGAGNWGQVAKVTASDAAAGDHFGLSVAISGDTAVIGAPSDSDAGDKSGSAYIFQRDQGGTDNWGQVTKLTASDASPYDDFGRSVSISGDTAVVGAWGDDDAGSMSGSAYIFLRDQGGADNWGQLAKLTASDAAASDWFGDSVSISGDTVVVGAWGDDDAGTDSGSAYIFQRDQGGADNWGQVAKLTALGGAAGDWFGISVSISGDTAVVGAWGDDDAGSMSGSAYIFQRDQGGTDNWGQVVKLTASDAAFGDDFGHSVSISGDTVVIGSHYDDDAGESSGSAYIFQRDHGGTDNWGQVRKLTASDAAADDKFGYSVSISEDTAVIGAYGNDDAGSASGSAYIFQRDQGGADNWGQVAKLTASDAVTGDYFGRSVSIGGDTVVIGAHHDDDAGDDSGSAYIFQRDQGGTDNWGQVTKLTASDAAADDWFGYAVSISGDTVVVGAYYDDDAGTGSGSAYVFQRDQGGADNWGQAAKLTALDAAALDYFGYSVSVSGTTVVIGAYGDDDAGTMSGSAYIFQRDQGGADNWGQVAKLTASDAAASDWFGDSVSISGDTVVVGAWGDDDAGDGSGSAYVFDVLFALTLLIKNPQYGRVLLDPPPSDANNPQYPPETDVTLTAEPNEGKKFTKWKVWDAYDANITVIDTNNPITIDMVTDRKVKAFFKCGGGGIEEGLPLLIVFATLALFALIRRRS